MVILIDFILLAFAVVIAIYSIATKDILNSVILLGAYSLFMALIWTYLNAVDVAFTEASVGAGITTVLMLAALSRTNRDEVISNRVPGLNERLPLAKQACTGNG